LDEEDTMFTAVTLDQLVKGNVLHEEETHRRFTERYLWWM
jgi:hypothetical protein